MSRTCGDCTLCCKLLAIEELAKPADKWCPHCKVSSGCTIYPDRPQACREFECLWLQGFGDEDLKPSRCKAFMWRSNQSDTVQIHVDIGRTWEGTLIEEMARRIAAAGQHVCVLQGTKRRFFKGEGQPLPDKFKEVTA